MKKFIVIRLEGRYKKIFIDDILYCKANGAYSEFYMLNNKVLLTSLLLKEVEEKLSFANFFRINRSYIANLDYCHEIITGTNPVLEFRTGEQLQVSREKLKQLVESFCTHS